MEVGAILAGYMEPVHLELFVNHQLDLPFAAKCSNLPQV
jgi:hypothetical protein